MAKRNRDTLKNFFKKGALPSEDQFGDLIDSTVNMVDEGFSKTPQNGLEIASLGEHDTLVSFFQGSDSERPTWTMAHGHDGDNLLFSNGEDKVASPLLALTPEGRVGVNTGAPEWDLDVKGVIRAEGRIGANPTTETAIPANGKWHDITGPLAGCHAFEVMAGVGKKKSGKYALMHAIAVNTFNPGGFFFNLFNLKKRIRYSQSYYYSLGDKLKLRWHQEGPHYYLQIRTNTDYGEGIRIRYYLTRLWFDEEMRGSWDNEG
jgi:hypothetical protein